MKLSVIIPFYYGKPNKVDLLHECIRSIGDEPDEILVIGNTSAGLPWSLNKGLRSASGDFLLIVSDDMVLTRGKLSDLCHEEFVTHPLISNEPQIFGGCVCYPRHVYEAVGDYDENFLQGYYDDDDYFIRVGKAGYERIVVSGVNMYHDDPGHTLRSLVTNEMMEYNKQYLMQKWGESCKTPSPSKIL
jgi:glycosyltransferase involved in cell wall biosynthesis